MGGAKAIPINCILRIGWVSQGLNPSYVLLEGGAYRQNSRDMRGEIAKLCLYVIARSVSDEAIHSFLVVAPWIASLRSQ
jgi:hypothetical protein